MSTATITSKGQVTIPAAVRYATGLTAGDRIAFVRESGGHYAIIPAAHSIKSLKGIVPRPDQPVSLEDIQAAIAAEPPHDWHRHQRPDTLSGTG